MFSVFATVPGWSINSWDSWFIFNLRKINTCYYTDTTCTWEGNSDYWWREGTYTYMHRTMYIWNASLATSMLVSGQKHLFTIMHMYWVMYILGLRSSWGTLRVRPWWSPSGHILTPALSPFRGAPVRSHACPEEVVYSLNDSCSHFTQRLFPPNVPHQCIVNILLWCTTITHIHIIHHIHVYIHILISYITLMYIHFTSSFLLLFVTGWLPSTLCVRYT